MYKVFWLTLWLGISHSFAQLYSIDAKVADFTLKNTDNKVVNLHDFKDKRLLVILFTTNNCPYFTAYQERIKGLQSKYGAPNIQFVLINPNDASQSEEDKLTDMATKSKEWGLGLPYLKDEAGNLAKAFGANKAPSAFLLLNNGTDFIVKYRGVIDDSPQLANQVKNMFLQKAIEGLTTNTAFTAETAQVGCSFIVKE